MTTLSERVSLILREHPELDQPGLGRIAGVTKGTVNQWLDGKIKSMKMQYAVRIEKQLGYRAAWLVMDEEPKLVNDAPATQVAEEVNSASTEEKGPLSLKLAREDRARLLADSILDVSNETRALIDKLVQADREGGAIREMTIAGVSYILQSIPTAQTQKKVK